MTAIDLQADTMQLLQQFDKTDTSLWKRILDAIAAIYQDEARQQAKKREEQKAQIRRMVGVLEESATDDWKQAKEAYLTEKYVQQWECLSIRMSFLTSSTNITIVPIGEVAVDRALALKANDFEDALQFFSAFQANSDFLLTRNVKDYDFASMPVLTPSDFLKSCFPNK